MADTVTTQTLLDGERLVIMKFTNLSDGTGESAVNKILPANLAANSFGVACTDLKINKIWSTTTGMAVNILWDAAADVLAWTLPQDTNYHMCFGEHLGGIPNNAGTGKTGNLAFSTVGATNGDSYSIIIECIKIYG
jgi:hypothetical protein